MSSTPSPFDKEKMPPSVPRLAGILQPVFALRTANDLGIGDTDGARQLVDWCHRHDLRIFQMLPITETSGDGSPYNAISASAIEPSTLAVSPEYVPDLLPEKFHELASPEILAQLRSSPLNYPKVKAIKQAFLEAAFAQFTHAELNRETKRAGEFHQFTRDHAIWIHDYAFFRALMVEHGDNPAWEQWPAEHKSPEHARRWLRSLPQDRHTEFERRVLFYTYVQWLAYGQWEALKAYATAKDVRLMGDIPIGIGRNSADVWAGRGNFDMDWSVGAPPEKFFNTDPFAEKWGQNWGAPLYRWDEMRQRNYDWWRNRVSLTRKIFHICRIDHVMGLFRIYAFPWSADRNGEFMPLDESQAAARTGGRLPGFRPFADDTPEHTAANQHQGEEILRVILDAAGDMSIVAEDLGIVPDYIRSSLHKLAIPGFRVPCFFREPDGRYSDPAQYPCLSVVQPATHDHPSLAATWADHWQQIDDGKNVVEHERELRLALDFAGVTAKPEREYSDALREGALRATLRANSILAVVMLADVFGQPIRFNTPGTAYDGNWSARMSETVEELDRDPNLLAKAKTFSRLVCETNRGTHKCP
jgi:4-alpha-glucanotransferase